MMPRVAVYYVKQSLHNPELRYSLRSVAKNWPEAEVWIVGYKPPWVQGVEYIHVPQEPGQKHPNAIRNQLTALTCPGLPDTYWSMNDDFYVMRPGATQYHWGFVEDVIESYGEERLGTSYHRSMIATLEICRDLGFEHPLSYQAHVPGLIHKEIQLECMRKYNREGVWIQHFTIAQNLAQSGGVELPFGDVKIYDKSPSRLPGWVRDSEYLSSSDRSFALGSIGQYVRAQFPDPCKYEV